ncbi:site-specific integrase [Candidatus Atribacteria bacterium 1244-E10-H5-B2]|nr:MAG: site-specific integrase [Candidatus Atribacteria bacterium 1244-E10-H5-B2]
MNFVEPFRDKQKILAIKKLLREEKSPRNYLIFTLGINSALRASDLLRLKVGDLLTDSGDIREYLYVKTKKTGRELKIYINDNIQKAIKFYIYNEDSLDPGNWLFYSKRNRNRAISRIRLWVLIRRWAKLVELNGERFGCHSLRKTWGYHARISGFNIEAIREKLGHRNSNITKRYLGITQREINDMEKSLNI